MRSVEFSGFWITIRSIKPEWLVGLSLITVISYFFRAWRWRSLLGSNSPRLRELFSATAVGGLANYIVPLRGGEIVRILAIRRRHPLNRIGTFAGTLILEKIFDIFAVILLILEGMESATLPETLTNSIQLLFLIFTSLLLGIITILSLRKRLEILVILIFNKLRLSKFKVEKYIRSFVDGFSAILSPKACLTVLSFTLLIWSMEALGVWMGAKSLGLDLNISGLFLVLGLLGLGLVLPSTPGSIGIYEFMIVTGLTTQGVEPTVAFAASVAMHGINFLMILIMGIASIWRESLDLGQIKEMARIPRSTTMK